MRTVSTTPWILAASLSMFSVFSVSCDEGGRRHSPPGLGADDGDGDEPTVSEIQGGFDRVLSDAAGYVGDQSNWIYPADPDGGDGSPDSGDGSSGGDDGGEAGPTCAGHCGDLGSDQSCYCDSECTSNDDCCDDYLQQCAGGAGDDGGGDPGPGDDGGSGDDGDSGGAAPGTCAEHCGDIGSNGVCYCDSECAANGDCCDDYASECSGAPAAATCAGYCGGQGSDGSCYCDESCVENGDCCDDYAGECGVGVVSENAFDFVGQLGPQAGVADACWAVLADPIDVQKVAELAGATALAAGGTCVAVAVVPAGAAAGPSLGLSVGAAALACGAVAVDGAAVGAVGSVLAQKLPSIANCSNEVINNVIRSFPWGLGMSEVRVKVYNQSPGNCEPDRHSFLQSQVNTTCKNAGQRRCTNTNVCETLAAKLQQAAECIAAREKVNDECYGGGDDGHNKAVTQEKELHSNCLSMSANLGC